MAVTRIEITSRTPYEDGQIFGAGGAYERIDGVIHFAVDPHDPANRAIVDLDRAKPDVDGRVHFLADFCLLQPVEPARANGNLLYNVVNRGRRGITTTFNLAPASLTPTEWIDPGDGWLMRHGWALAFCGWQWDVFRSHALMGLEAPQALDESGRPIQGEVMVRFQPNAWIADHQLADREHQPYPAADVDDPDAVLTVQDWPDGPRTRIPRDRWQFARDQNGSPAPDDGRIRLEGGFAPGRVYEVVYRTRICPVVGTGLLAMRDCVSFLRHGNAAAGNPSAGRIRHTFGFGASQSGRYLRTYLYHGLNLDEQGRQVFDGLIPHVCGAWRGQFNHRYAQPSEQHGRGFIHLPPFADEDQTDPVTGVTDGLLHNQRAAGGVPRIMFTNTAAEYWRGDASLMHTDYAGTRDVEPPAEVRNYYFTGTQHGPGALPLNRVSLVDGARGANDFNVLDYRPLLRATLVNLERWVVDGVEPPPSAFPHLADGTAVPARRVAAEFRRFPTSVAPDPEKAPVMRRLDLGPEADRGIGRYPAVAGDAWPTFVAAIDDDGNEMAGIRLPDVAVPVATYTGWNPRGPEAGGEGQILPMVGSTVPFPATPAERERTGDPRASIADRYRDRADYESRVRHTAESLVAGGYLLAEDVDIVIEHALAGYDAFSRAPTPVAGDGG
jgi:hypothetical protein